MRQHGVKLILSNQTLSQLQRGDVDLRPLMFTAQNRMVFGLQGEDADILAHEFATIRYDPEWIKQEIHSTKQRQAGYRVVEFHNYSESENTTESSSSSMSDGTSDGSSTLHESPLAESSD